MRFDSAHLEKPRQQVGETMLDEPQHFKLRAVVTEVDDGFIVSVCSVSPREDPTLLEEIVVPTLSDARGVIEKRALQMGQPPEKVQTIYNLAGVPPDPNLAH
jgi:hypothetical protein